MDLGLLIFIGFTGFAVFVGAVVIKRILSAHHEVQHRGDTLAPTAARHGLTFRELKVDEDHAEPLLARTLFVFAYGEPATVMSGTHDGLRLDVFESVFRRGGRIAHHRAQLAFVFSSPTPRWPRLVIQSEWSASEPKDTDASLADVTNVELELEAFEEEYTVAARSPAEAKRLVTPALQQGLLALVKEGVPVTIESFEDRVVLWREEETVDGPRFENLLLLAARVRRLLEASQTRWPWAKCSAAS